MSRMLQTGVFWGAALVLAGALLTGAARAQTVDSWNIQVGTTTSGSSPMVYTVVPLPDGKVLAGGSAIRFLDGANQACTNIVRLNSDGSIDGSFRVSMTGVSATPGVVCLALQTNGQVFVGGSFASINGRAHYCLARLNPDGTVDDRFDAGYIDGLVAGLRVLPDTRILVWGGFTKVNSQPCTGLCRLNNDGSLDTNFNAQANSAVNSVAVLPDGKLLALGPFSAIGGQWRTNLARLTSDGTLDSSFLPVTFKSFGRVGLNGLGSPLALQPNGQILAGSLFESVNGFSHTNLVRLNADGSLDSGFNVQADYHNCWGVQTFTLQTDGKILVGHDSYTINGSPSVCLSRLNADGSLDAAFRTNMITGSLVFSCAEQADGRVMAGGSFGMLCGQSRWDIGRLRNTELATQSLSYDGTTIQWLRGGTSPEVWRTTFEASLNGTDWTYLGEGQRINGGWQLADVSVPADAIIRARGFVFGGRFCGSSWFVESVWPRTQPTLVPNDGTVGFRAGQFGFSVSGSAGSSAIVEASSALGDWTPLSTNMLPSGPLYLSDPASSNAPCRFYRVRGQD